MNQITPDADGYAHRLLVQEELTGAADIQISSKRRRDRVLLGLLLLVALITILYNFVVATPRYASEFSYVVRSIDSSSERLSILNVAATGGSDNSEAIVAYIRSRDMLEAINRDGLVSRVFSKPGLDPISAFPSPFSGRRQEGLFKHFQHYVKPAFNARSNITHVEVQAFSPGDARTIALRVMQASEQMVNGLNERARTSLVVSAQKEVDAASLSLATTLNQLNAARNLARVVDPKLETGAAVKVSSGVASELAQINVELAQTLRATPTSPTIAELRTRRAAIEAELIRQTSSAAGTPGSLADRIRPYEELASQRDIAEDRLLAASLSLASARADANRTQLYVERISEPNLPDVPKYPRAWQNLLIVLAVTIGILWIARSLSELVLSDND